MVPYFTLEYTTGKFAGKAFNTCTEQGGSARSWTLEFLSVANNKRRILYT
jgi:hypothetical protein